MLPMRQTVSELSFDTGVLCHFPQAHCSVLTVLTFLGISSVSGVPGTHWTEVTMTSTRSRFTPCPNVCPLLPWSGSCHLSSLGAPQFYCFLHWLSLVTLTNSSCPKQGLESSSSCLDTLLLALSHATIRITEAREHTVLAVSRRGEGKVSTKGGKYQGHLGNLCCKYVLLKLFLCLVGRFWVKIPDRSSKHTHCLLPH